MSKEIHERDSENTIQELAEIMADQNCQIRELQAALEAERLEAAELEQKLDDAEKERVAVYNALEKFSNLLDPQSGLPPYLDALLADHFEDLF